MAPALAWLLSGLLFGAGLSLSGMINPRKVLAFLDVTGNWDPTLLLVMGGAVATTALLFRLVLRRPAPVLAQEFYLPTRTDLDVSLIVGSAMFGAGWGLAGYCPGPALAAFSVDFREPVIFCAAMIAGMFLRDLFAVIQRDQ
ncbi:MAG: YeeE/YedE family protein [Gammaproteobacteria bacterium]|nr:YeeE/YedE family protein [Gammaproteobacteria bacterium]